MKDLIIAIPSYGRAQHINSGSDYCTATHIRGAQWEDVIYYVEPEEQREYQMALPKGCKLADASRAEVPKKWGSIMDLIVDECSKKCKRLVIMDDDLRVHLRPGLPEHPTLYKKADGLLFAKMIKELTDYNTMDHPLVSTQYRHFCQVKIKPLESNQRISMIWSMTSKFFNYHPEYRFYKESKLDFVTDYYFFLKLLTDGYSNLVLNKYTKDDKPNAAGGEQAKRTHKVFNAAIKKFAAMFPRYVTTYEKKNKTYWEDGTLGMRIQAAKAYKEAKDKK